jgi:hypothetical protein
VQILIHGGDDEFFIGFYRLAEYAELPDPEIDAFCFAGFEKLFMFIKNFQYVFVG